MEPVISPMYLYLIDLLSTIRDISFIDLLLFGVICLLAMLTFFEESDDNSLELSSSKNNETELTEKDKTTILKIFFFIFTQFISHLQRKENSCYVMLKGKYVQT